jgi:curved DNA-binding protein
MATQSAARTPDTDLYRVLGLTREATPDQIKKAFRKLAKQHHPDRNPGDPKAQQRFVEVSRAFEVLSDPERRAAYDEFGPVSLESGFDAERARAFHARSGRGGIHPDGAFHMDDLLGELFGRSRGRAAGGFGGFEGFEGFEGFDSGAGPGRQQRRGQHLVRARLVIDFRTAALGGERELQFEGGQTQKVRIPPGVRDGETLRLAGQAPGGADLGLTLEIAPDPVFRREGEDLHLQLPVTVPEAIRGARVPVPTLDGQVELKIPAGSQSGRKLRLRSKGVRRRDQTGDLYVELVVVVPSHADEDALRALERSYDRDVRAQLYS